MQPFPCSLLLFLLATYVPRPSSVVHTVDLFVLGRRENVLFSLFHSIYLWNDYVFCIMYQCVDGYDEIMECFIMTPHFILYQLKRFNRNRDLVDVYLPIPVSPFKFKCSFFFPSHSNAVRTWCRTKTREAKKRKFAFFFFFFFIMWGQVWLFLFPLFCFCFIQLNPTLLSYFIALFLSLSHPYQTHKLHEENVQHREIDQLHLPEPTLNHFSPFSQSLFITQKPRVVRRNEKRITIEVFYRKKRHGHF